jgi:flagellar protein FlgJ
MEEGIKNINPIKNMKEEKFSLREKKLKELCEEFESILIYQLLKEARKTIPENQGIFKKSFVQKIYEDMLYQEYARLIAKNYQFGIAEKIYNSLSKSK